MQASLSPERWEQIQRLFNEVVDLPGEARAAHLDDACRDDPALRDEVESLLDAYAQADDLLQGLEQIAAPPPEPPADAGSRQGLRVSHYDVLEKLGGGGMGVVYKARDVKLDRLVALKFLPPHLDANAAVRRRFVQEAKAASALDHPNICAIYEIGETGPEANEAGQLFIAMAHYSGETLKAKIKRGPLPLDEALGYAVQMARGLERAHEAAIVHRDIKPANVIVTDRGVVKVLDFGLAKMADVKLTRSGATMGTVAYMSPEQARGDKVDHRTDLWSLGVVLYEMLTGQLPFDGEYEQAIIYALLNQEPTPVTEVNPEVPDELAHVVALCLEKDRDLRYPTMRDVLADLEVFAQGSGSGSATALRAVQQRQRKTRQRQWRRNLMLGAGLFGLLALVVLIVQNRQRVLEAFGGPRAAPQQHVAVLPFLNNLGEDNQALVDGMTQILTNMLARLETPDQPLWVVPPAEIFREQVTTAQEAQRLFNVSTVLQGDVQRMGSDTLLTLTLVDPITRHIRDSKTMQAPLRPALLEDVLAEIAALLEVDLNAEARLAVNLGRPTRPDAYTFYLQGQGYLQRLNQPGNLDNALTVFQQALEEDPDYAPAYAGLCEASWEQYIGTSDTALAEQALAYCDRAAALAADQPAVLVTLGRVYKQTGQYQRAEAELQRALNREPTNADAHRWLGWVYADLARFDDAEKAFRRAVALKPNVWVYYDELGMFLDRQGRHAEALDQFEQVRRLTPDNYLAYNNLGVEYRELNEVEKAKQQFQESLARQPNDVAARNLGRLYFRDQQYADAVRELERASDLKPRDAGTWNALGHAYYWAGDSAKAEAAWSQMITLAEAGLTINPSNQYLQALLVDAHAALGHRAQSLAYLDSLAALPHHRDFTPYYMARAYAILGEKDQALTYIGLALNAQYDPITIDRDPWFADLLDEPRYRALRQRVREPDT